MTLDEVLGLVHRNEIVCVDNEWPTDTRANEQCRYRELLMFSSVRALLLRAGHSEFESNGMAGDVMSRLG
jgi:hypothetical protein